MLTPARTPASPIDDPHVGGIGFAGATTDDLSALYWNPAALGLGTGTRVLTSFAGRLGSIGVTRAPIDPVTGQPGGGRAFQPASGRVRTLPQQLPLGPGSFLALGGMIGSRFTFAFGTFAPFVQRHEFRPAADGTQPLRYQSVATDLSTVALSAGASVLLGEGVRVGLAPSLLFSTARLVVDHDTGAPSGMAGAARTCGEAPCGAENPAAAARYSLASDADFFDRPLSFTLGLGLHVNRALWSLGIAWTSPPLGTREGIEIEGRNSHIDLPPRLAVGGALCPPGLQPCVASRMVYRLPMNVTAAFDRRLAPRWDVGLQIRWVDLSVHDSIAVRVVGPADGTLRRAGLPEELLLHRGLKDVLDVRVRSLVRLGERIEVVGTLRGETASVPTDVMNAANVGGALLEPSLAVRLRLSTWLVFTGGYAFTFMPAVGADPSGFDPGANAACEATGGDLAAAACEKRRLGLAAPTTAGRYRLHGHGFALSLAAQL